MLAPQDQEPCLSYSPLCPKCLAQCLVHNRWSVTVCWMDVVKITTLGTFPEVIATITFPLSNHWGFISCGLNLQCCHQSLANAELYVKRSCIHLRDHEYIFQHYLKIMKCHIKAVFEVQSAHSITADFFQQYFVSFLLALCAIDCPIMSLSMLTLNFISMKAK